MDIPFFRKLNGGKKKFLNASIKVAKHSLFIFVLLFYFLQGEKFHPPQLWQQFYQHYQTTQDLNLIKQILTGYINHSHLKNLILFLKSKNDPKLDQTVFKVLENFSKIQISENIYFSPKEKRAYLNSLGIYREAYYKILLFQFEFEILTKEILTRIDQGKNLDIEIKFFELIAAKKADQKKIFQLIDNHSFTTTPTTHDPKFQQTKMILKNLFLFFSKQYQEAYDLLLSIIDLKEKKQNNKNLIALSNSLTPTKKKNAEKKFYNFHHLERIFKTHQINFLDWLYKNGFYHTLIKLYQKIDQLDSSQVYSYSPEKIQKSIYLSRIHIPKTLSKMTPRRSIERNWLYQNQYDVLSTNYLKTGNLEISHEYLLALAATGQWKKYTGIVNQMGTEKKKNYLWIKTLFLNPREIMNIEKNLNQPYLNHWQIDFSNLVDKFGEKEIDKIAFIIQRLIVHDQQLESFLQKNKKEIPTFLYEYAISKMSYHYFKEGNEKKCEFFFENYYHLLTLEDFKEKLMLYHGLSKIKTNPKEGKKILFKLLYLNPQTTSRFEIEEALESLL